MNHEVFGGFFNFIIKANVIGLALGLMLGNATTQITGHLVDDIIFPIIKPISKLLQLGKYKVPGGATINVTGFSKSLMKFVIILTVVGLMCKISGMTLTPPVMAVEVVKTI